MDKKLLNKSINNLLNNCAELNENDTLLIISEDSKFGWYDKDISIAVYDYAKNKLGLSTELLIVGEPKNNAKDTLEKIIDNYDCAIFFARIGDQERFEKPLSNTKRIMSYVRNIDSLCSLFASTNYEEMKKFKDVINKIIFDADNIEISCPLGTNLKGTIDKKNINQNKDTSIVRFPVVVPSPILAKNFSGEVVLDGYLTSTGSKVYEPISLKIESPVTATILNGKIANLNGEKKVVEKIVKHYETVSKIFNIDHDIVHSWHAGINPGIHYSNSVEENPDRWSNTIFPSPKYLHFHTCGNYAPGEICWMIANHNIKIDNVPLWENGILKVCSFDETIQHLQNSSDLKNLYNT
ncbi:hypothetical protein OBA40_00625 [Alphaproteobacteria bacterium]|nr:hypothetical protein [Alphaproteobacteria bacterium]